MTILIVSEMSVPYAVGGGEVRYALLSRELAKRGHEVTWLSMRQRESPDEEMIDGVRHVHRGPRIASPPSRPLFAMLRFMVTAFWHVLTHRYSIIDCQTYAPLPAVWLACLLSRQKMVATIHDVSRGTDGQWMTNRWGWLTGFAETTLYRIPYGTIIAVSQSTADALVRRWGVTAARVHVVPNGIELPSEPAAGVAPQRDIDLIYAGRFVPTKNIGDLIEVVGSLHADGTVGRVTLVGEGPLWEEMVVRARNAGLADVIEFTGRMANAEVLDRLRRAKVFFHASSREGFPVVMVEAMACGLPVVAYRIPGVVDVIDDGITGVLVTEHDTQAHAAACSALLHSPTERTRLAENGRRTVTESLTIQTMTDRVSGLYRESSNA
jgi:glycosyltransferase involved in cell wall biosynthesis